MDEAVRRAIREAERSGHRLVPRPPDSVLTALRIVARAGSVVAEALVTIAIQLKRPGQDLQEVTWNPAWRADLRDWLDSLGAGSTDWDKEATYPKSMHSVEVDDAMSAEDFDDRIRRAWPRRSPGRGYED